MYNSYFKGKVTLDDEEYTINIQEEKRGKVLKIPKLNNFENKKCLIRVSGPDVFIEDIVPYCGESEWLEIDSDEITFYLADNQDKFDTIEIIL